MFSAVMETFVSWILQKVFIGELEVNLQQNSAHILLPFAHARVGG